MDKFTGEFQILSDPPPPSPWKKNILIIKCIEFWDQLYVIMNIDCYVQLIN